MRRAAAALLLALALGFAGPAAAQQPARASLPDLEDELMCLLCGTALNVANGPAADQERRVIRAYIAQGLTKEQIKDRLVDEYGPEVLALPDDEGFDLAVYLVPALLLIGGGAGVALLAGRWRRRGPVLAETAAAELDPEDARRLDAELTAFDR